jgi:hypothetical protein
MGLLGRFGRTGGDPAAKQVRGAAEGLARAALASVQDQATGRVRAEDYVAVLAAVTGEAALVSGLRFDIEASPLTPGSAVFGPGINEILSGDSADTIDPDSVVAILRRELIPATAAEDVFPDLLALYRDVAANVGRAAWGTVATTVDEAHRPGVVPLQVAFELRSAVERAQSEAGLPTARRYVPCALALAIGLRQVSGVAPMRVVVPLALEVVFGMAKMAPISRAAFDAAGHRHPNQIG